MFPPICCFISQDKLPQKILNDAFLPDICHKIEYLEFLSDPLFMGISEYTTEIDVAPFEESAIFRFCSFDSNFLAWPASFQINICGKWVKKTKNDHSLFHYLPNGISLTEKLPVRCGVENEPFIFIIQKIKYNSELLFTIPVVSGNIGLTTSPISGKKMLFPVRSNICKHNQCSEIDEFVSSVDRKGKCPMCGIPVSLSSTIVDSEIHKKALIDSLLTQQNSDQSSFDFMDFF